MRNAPQPFIACLMAAALALGLAGPTAAQETTPPPAPHVQTTTSPSEDAAKREPGRRGGRAGPGADRGPQGGAGDGAARAAAEVPRLPAKSSVELSLPVGGKTLPVTATAGSIEITDEKGKPTAEIAFIAYTLNGADPKTRPVTFAMNGGPGSASGWLQLGALGPWRLSMAEEAIRPSAPADLLPNAETWLDLTDLVFVDPVGTGVSQSLLADDETKKQFYSVNGDIVSLAQAIRRWLERNERLNSPKMFVGESYAGFRTPKLLHRLQTEDGIGIGAAVMLSPVIDFDMFAAKRYLPWHFVSELPTYAAAARERKGPVSRADLADVEAYAQGEFLTDLVKGEHDADAVARIVAKVTALTGLDPALVKRLGGRIDRKTFKREFDRDKGTITSGYDATIARADPFPTYPYSEPDDSATGALTAPFTEGMLQIYKRLKWPVEGRYRLTNMAVNRAWDYGRGGLRGAESLTELKKALALDPALEVTVAHGLFDMVTPYFGSKLMIDQVAVAGLGQRLRLVTFPGGHMFYSRDASRVALHKEAEGIVARLLAQRK